MSAPQVNRTSRVAAAFRDHFGTDPVATAFAPGRVNLLGEHTDYNGGFVLPMPLSGLGVAVAIGPGPAPGVIEAYSDTFHDAETRNVSDSREGRWSDYVLGALKAIAEPSVAEAGTRIALTTTLPMGAGLSSSAALEVASLRAAAALYGVAMSPVEVAVMARTVENVFVGMPCGIMDQFAASVGSPGEALFLDTRTLDYRPAPVPDSHGFVIVHSGVSHQLTQDGYATRVAECTAAAEALGVVLLSDLGPGDLDRLESLPALLARRSRHIVTENQRVLDGLAALRDGDMAQFGRLMVESHASQRDDYDITVPETDAMVEAALAAGALGARQTGGGFGGAVVALASRAEADAIGAALVDVMPGGRVLAVT